MAQSLIPPSSTALRTFLAVAAHGSTTRAGHEIHLTQSAVSKQIRALEAHLGVSLFDRQPQGLKLTEAGEIYKPYAQAALEQMLKGMQRLKERGSLSSPLRLHMIAIVGERWLMGRFSTFAEAHPEIDVQFTNFTGEHTTVEPDLVIRHGDGLWPGWHRHYLFGRHVSLVAAPALIERMGGFDAAADIQRVTLLQHFQMPAFWAELTEAFGLRGAVPARTVRYGYFSVIIRAAIAGLGAALIPTCFVREELASGTLVNPLGLGFSGAAGIWLLVPDERPLPPGAAALVDWMLAEAQGFETTRA